MWRLPLCTFLDFMQKKFQTTIASEAQYSDLLALKLLLNIIDHQLPIYNEMSMKLHNSIRRQDSWYLAAPLDCLSLADEDLSATDNNT